MNDQLKKLEETLQIKFEEHDYNKKKDNVYTTRGGSEHVTGLQIKAVRIDDINILLPFAKKLYRLTLINCIIGDFSSLIHLKEINQLKLDNVTIENMGEIGQENGPALFGNPAHVYLKNMSIPHLSAFLPLTKGINHLFITDCTVHNFYEVNLLSNLYDLRLDGVTIIQSETDVIHTPKPDRHFWRICLSNMKLKDLSVFVPVSENVGHICIDSSTIDSIRELHVFKSLRDLEMDGNTIIKDREPSKDNVASFELSKFIFDSDRYRSGKEEQNAKFDLQNLGSIAHCIKTMSFKEYAVDNADFIQHFSRLEKLEFENSTVPLSDFLPVAHQIKKAKFDESRLTEVQALEHFKQLEHLRIDTNYDKEGIHDFKHLLPLKHQLKKLELDEDGIKNVELIKEFTALEGASLTTRSIEETESVLSTSSLRRLQLHVEIDPVPEPPPSFNLKGLPNLQALSLSCDNLIPFDGIEFLTELERLDLDFTCPADRLGRLQKLRYLGAENGIDINIVPAIPSLEVLELNVEEDYEVHSLEQFPNLERLSIQASNKINLGKLEKLKVFKAQWIDLETTKCFENVPNLEKLELSYCGITVVKNLDKLTKLKMLNLSENDGIENIDGLENLKSLEYLNLYDNKVSNISVLNKLPNLIQANLDYNYIAEKDIPKLLDKPEVACFISIPYIPFSIWKTEYFEV